MNCVNWYEAFAFCIWDGGRLPTEAEWNYAAAGGSEQRRYPWSAPPDDATIDETYASYWVDDARQCFGDGMVYCSVTDLVPVGSKPRGNGRWGQADMAGNVSEWVVDWLDGYPDSCTDCANLVGGVARVIRGGNIYTDAVALGSGDRDYADASFRGSGTIGVRCARAP